MFNNVYLSSDVERAKQRVFFELRKILDANCETSLSLSDGTILLQTSLQTLFNVKFDDVLCNKIYEIILTHATSAEKTSSGGFIKCLKMICDKNFSKNNLEHFRYAKHATKSNVNTTVERFISDSNLQQLLISALDLAGFGGRILVEKSSNSNTSLELSSGYSFSTFPGFPVTKKLIKPRVFCIDGYIERVSEIDHILRAAHESLDHCLLCVRGMHDEVKHTLKVNFDRSTLFVIPIIVKFELNGINTLNDIATVCGGDIVSTNKGDIISAIKYESSKRIETAVVYPTKLVLVNQSTKKNVSNHVQMLLKKRSESVDDVQDLLDERIRSLSPGHVIIKIPDDKDFVTKSQMIDYTLRAIRSLIDHGVDENNDLMLTTIISTLQAQKCHELLGNMGAVVI